MVHGRVRWLVRTPLGFGGGRTFYEKKEDATTAIDGFRSRAATVVGEFRHIPRRDQIELLSLYQKFNGDTLRLRQAAESGSAKLPTNKLTGEAIGAFLSDHKAGEKRTRNVAFYLGHLRVSFRDKNVGDIDDLEIKRWLDSREWSGKTYNDCRQVLGQFWKYAIKRKWAAVNPVLDVPVRKVPRHMVQIYTPEELRSMLAALEQKRPLFVPAIALGAFTGMRVSEIARLTWEQVGDGLKTGHIELTAAQVGKTLTARTVPVLPALRSRLENHRKDNGLVLPERWKNKKADIGEMGSFISRLTKVPWKANGLRHSYATYRFKLTNDVGQTVDEMGTSIAKFEKHYRSKSKLVTVETATEWFSS